MIDRFKNYLSLELNRSLLTVEAYMRDLTQFSEWLGGENPTETDFISVTASDARAWFASLARQGDTPRTIRRKAQSLRAFYRWMMKEGVIKISPLRDIPLPKLPKPLPDLVKPQEVEEAISLTEHSDEPTSKNLTMENLILEMLYSLGIRRAELIALNDSDISFTNGEIKITGKRSKQRIIPAPQQLFDKIKIWQHTRDLERESQNLLDSPLFIYKGKRINASKVYSIVNTYLQGSSAKKKSPHALRHSFASAMLNGGADLDSVREFLGHTSLATTQIYTHVSFNEIKKAYSTAHPRAIKTKK